MDKELILNVSYALCDGGRKILINSIINYWNVGKVFPEQISTVELLRISKLETQQLKYELNKILASYLDKI